MEEVKDNMSELVKLMHKTGKAMEMTRQKQSSIDTLKSTIMEEVRPMMVEKMKEDIKLSEEEKKEFDEMTKNAMIEAKKNILEIRDASEKEYNDKLIQFMQKQKRIEEKLASIKGKELPEEKLEMAEKAAKNALDSAKSEMQDFQRRHFIKRAKLDEFEKNINDWANELDFEKELASVVLESQNKTDSKETRIEGIRTEKTAEKSEMAKSDLDNKKDEMEDFQKKHLARKEETARFEENIDKWVSELYSEKESANEPLENVSEPKETKPEGKLIKVKAEGKTYTFEYEKGQEEIKKMGFFRTLAEKVKLVANRDAYGITMKQAWQADANIVKNISEEDKETYLSYISETGKGDCFTIEYAEKEGKQAKRLEGVNDRWVKKLESQMTRDEMLASIKREVDIKNAEILQQKADSKRHDEKQSKYDEMFGTGFDQHENPPTFFERPGDIEQAGEVNKVNTELENNKNER